MTVRLPLAAAALAACLVARPAGAAAMLTEPASPEFTLPGIDLEGLSAEQKQAVAAFARETFCYCGCPHTLSQCLKEHKACRHAGRMARLAVRLLRAGGKTGELARTVGGYYASFDKRARLTIAGFGPPLGGAASQVTFVEFSDFTCPYCRIVRPTLEAFVDGHAAQVRLFYKPFPIESHPGALETAQAGEWARDKGLFWPMHDAMFGHPDARTVSDLANLASSVGGDPADLRAALDEKRFLSKVRESQAEARAAGLKGTPTLFIDGRMHVLSDFTDDGLEFTLEDEEEWVAHRGWQRD